MERMGRARRFVNRAATALVATSCLLAAATPAGADAMASARSRSAGSAAWAGSETSAGSATSTNVDLRATAEHGDGARWAWPVTPPVLLLEPFRAPPTPYGSGHRGLDLAAEPGGVVVVPDDGLVTFAGRVVDRDVIVVDHGDGVVSAMEPVGAEVGAGTLVRRGDVVGRVGEGGHCDGRCVHLGVRLDGAYVSPLLWLGGVPRAVLLPSG
ncbi:M23 family metallopeptidase [Agromyces sp. SYSU T0242]|uniref:M23 family metallopeptidase n=1 Tax=Agromyces litoreus TaxID=3158561 RepID=UPI003397807C